MAKKFDYIEFLSVKRETVAGCMTYSFGIKLMTHKEQTVEVQSKKTSSPVKIVHKERGFYYEKERV